MSNGEPTPLFNPWFHTGMFVSRRTFPAVTQNKRNFLTFDNIDYTVYVLTGAPEAAVIQPEPVTHVTAVSVTLIWRSGFHSGSPQTFTVQYKKRGDEDYITDGHSISDPGYQRLAQRFISNLTEKTQYEFRVTAHNQFGTSYSQPATFKTRSKYSEVLSNMYINK